MSAGPSPPSLVARGLLLLRGDRVLFRDLDLCIRAGQVLQVEGANGSGKTSLLRVLAGLVPVQEGRVLWRGRDVTRRGLDDELVWVGHRPGFKGDLTLAENLRFESGLRRRGKLALPDILDRLDLRSLERLPFRVLSAGQQRRAALARVMLTDAALWLLDEPLTNLDVSGQSLVTGLLDAHLAAGGLAVVASHRDLGTAVPVTRVRLS